MRKILLFIIFISNVSFTTGTERKINTSCTEEILDRVFSLVVEGVRIEDFAKHNIDSVTLELNKSMKTKLIFLNKSGEIDYSQIRCTKTGAIVKDIRLVNHHAYLVVLNFKKEDGWKILNVIIDDSKKGIKEYIDSQK